MKCGECSFCIYEDAIKEFVCSAEPECEFPVVIRTIEHNCKMANPICHEKTNNEKGVHD